MRSLLCLLLLLASAAPALAQSPSPTPVAQGPGHVLYVDGKSPSSVAVKWLEVVGQRPELVGSAYVKPDGKGWTGLVVKGLEKLDPEKASGASKALSDALDTGVLHLAVTPDGRAWYFYWKDGKLVDRYCSNPGKPDEVPYETLRSWQGRPDLLLPVSRGTPLSQKRTEVSLTDFNGFLYFYHPEMKTTKPAAWRSATEVMRLLTQLVGVSQPPAPFATVATLAGWKRL